MFEYLGQFFVQMKNVFMGLPASRKIVFLMVVGATIAGFVALSIWANQPNYQLLYAGLSQSEAGEIVTKLKEQKVPYKLDSGGSTILVPKAFLHETRLSLATEGLPRGGSVGMEIFNKSSLSTTSFVQRMNYQRAVQGELERTIVKFDEVQEVRIHLNIPKESLFLEDARKPSASVAMQLYPNRSLNQAQILGIVHLVASAVEGLKPEAITLVDMAGGLIYKKDDDADGTMLTGTQIQQRKLLEKTYADRVTSMLEKIVGPNNAVTRVTVELDFNRINTTEETFNPDLAVVRSEQRTTEKTSGPARGATGPPTARYDLGANQSQSSQASQFEVFEKTEETINYDIAKINKQTIVMGGGVKRLSVAVIVDGTYTEKEDEDGKIVKTFVPRSETELEGLTKVVRSAIGYDEDRGDTVVVSSYPFYVPEEREPSAMERWWVKYLNQAAKPALNILLIFLFFLFVVRPMVGWIKREAKVIVPEPPEGLELPGVRPGILPEEIPPEEVPLPDRIKELTSQNPDRALDLIQAWISE